MRKEKQCVGNFDSEKLYELLRTIPRGYVVTYGMLAEWLGNKGLARAVGNALHHNPDGDKYPCYKVVNAKGALSRAYAFGGIDGQRRRLEADGILVEHGKVNLEKYRVTPIGDKNMHTNFDVDRLQWTGEPADFTVSAERIEIVTKPNTDLWQRTYYHFRNDNAPVLQMETEEKLFSFTVKTQFQSKRRFDQCGIVMYLDSDNWIKASIEYENDRFQHLGSVVTNNGYSDWATTEIDANIKSMWYRFSRREVDYLIECSDDGTTFRQMRVCHMWKGGGRIRFGIYACSPEESSFQATFTDMKVTECKWRAHDGQPPDAE